MHERDRSYIWRVLEEPRGWPAYSEPGFDVWVAADLEELEDVGTDQERKASDRLDERFLDMEIQKYEPKIPTELEEQKIRALWKAGRKIGNIAAVFDFAWQTIDRIVKDVKHEG